MEAEGEKLLTSSMARIGPSDASSPPPQQTPRQPARAAAIKNHCDFFDLGGFDVEAGSDGAECFGALIRELPRLVFVGSKF